MLKRIKAFREKTYERYNENQKKTMEPWKEHVLKLHEESGFLFYYENCEVDDTDGIQLIIQGDIAKDERIKEKRTKPLTLYLYDGQGRLLGKGLIMSDPFEKEEKKRGFLQARKHEFTLKIIRLYGEKFQELDQSQQRKLLLSLYSEISLLSDICQ